MRHRCLVFLVALMLLLGGVAVPAVAQTVVESPFTDVSADDEHAEHFAILNALQIFEGYGDGRVGPGDPLNRAAFSKVVVAMLGLTDQVDARADQVPDFEDRESIATWAWGWISTAHHLGIIRGYPDGRFGPDDSVRLDEAVTMLVRALGYEAFVDGQWPLGHLQLAERIGLLMSVPSDPRRELTREEMAELTRRAMLVHQADADTGQPDESRSVLMDAFRYSGHLAALTREDMTLESDAYGEMRIRLAPRVTLRGAPSLDTLRGVEVEVYLNLNDEVALVLPVEPMELEEAETGEMYVHFIDVGQGDAILIETDNVTILIDGGVRSAGEIVVQYLVQRGIRELDLVIGTHPHADHIGGLIEVLRNFKVHSVIDAGVPHTTITFDDYLTEIEKQVATGHCSYETPQGQVVTAGALTLTVLGPGRDLGSLNDNSVVARVDFGRTSFLFTGDAERASEEHLLSLGVNLGADVLKVGHHGSRTSTTPAFLQAVSPAHAVIQVGEGNRYGHPNEEVLQRLVSAGVSIYRTDQHGTVVFASDGETLTVDASPWDDTASEPEPDPPVTGRININTASFEQLQEIIHIGPERAEEIIRLRPFRSLDGLTAVTGIGPGRLQDIKDQGIAYVE